jgi:hypothetical protein
MTSHILAEILPEMFFVYNQIKTVKTTKFLVLILLHILAHAGHPHAKKHYLKM